jgi:hypothetical protein
VGEAGKKLRVKGDRKICRLRGKPKKSNRGNDPDCHGAPRREINITI